MATSSKWTAEEDSILVDAVLAAGSRICWNTIAERLQGRSNKSCRKRWIHSLDPSLRKGRWTTPEDALLIMAVRRHGRHWYKVAELLPGRTDDQCAKRWREKLDPSIRRDPWTEPEDLKLLEALAKHGKRWNIISGCIKGRPAVQCRNRFLSLQRAGKVSEDGKSSASTIAGRNTTSGTDTVKTTDPSDHAMTDVDARPDSSNSPTISAGSPSSSSPYLSSFPSSPSPAEPSLPMWDSVSVASSPPLVSMEGLDPSQLPTDPQAFPMGLDFVGADFFNGQGLGLAAHLNSPSSSSIASPSGILSDTFKLDDPKYTGSPLTFPSLSSADPPFSWGENLIMPTDGTVTPSQTVQDPTLLLVQELIQKSNTQPPTIPSPDSSGSFVMTCPLPLCSHQSSELISIWRHLTWDHLGHTNMCSKPMTELVERVVLGGADK